MPFQINTSKLFLTYPQCDVSMDECLRQLTLRVADYNLQQYIVAHELHANGDHHLHCYLSLERPFRSKDPRCFDLHCVDLNSNEFTYHGNYQGCRSAKNVLKYCSKGEDYLSNFDVSVVLGKRSTRAVIAEELVVKKAKLTDLVHDHPCLIFGYSKLKSDLLSFQEDSGLQTPDLPPFLPNPWGKVLPSGKRGKQRHYWIFSRKPNLGKTYHFARPLESEYGAVIVAGDFTYWNVTRGTKLLILDDYNTASLKWNQLNTLADGTFSFRAFHRGCIKVDSYLVVIISNRSIRDIYPNCYEFIHARFKEIELV